MPTIGIQTVTDENSLCEKVSNNSNSNTTIIGKRQTTRHVHSDSHPNKQNFSFLRKLGLKTIMYFAMEDYPPEMKHFVEHEGIEVLHFRMEGNKEPFVEVNKDDISLALVKLLDERSHPVLIHCLKGKHRIGCLVGCLRKIQKWSMTCIFDEYRKFAGTKVLADQEFIETFDHENVQYDPLYQPVWL
ncbi:unnamed protein product [Absidia cylindrospora]